MGRLFEEGTTEFLRLVELPLLQQATDGDEFGRQRDKAPVLGIRHRVLFRVAGLSIECREFAPRGRQRRVQTHSPLIGGACTIRLGERPENVTFFLVGACVLGRKRLQLRQRLERLLVPLQIALGHGLAVQRPGIVRLIGDLGLGSGQCFPELAGLQEPLRTQCILRHQAAAARP